MGKCQGKSRVCVIDFLNLCGGIEWDFFGCALIPVSTRSSMPPHIDLIHGRSKTCKPLKVSEFHYFSIVHSVETSLSHQQRMHLVVFHYVNDYSLHLLLQTLHLIVIILYQLLSISCHFTPFWSHNSSFALVFHTLGNIPCIIRTNAILHALIRC